MSNCDYELLENAVADGDLEFVKLLLSAGADVNVSLGTKQETFLHLARDVEIIKELLSHGANVNAKNISGETPLHLAVRNPKIDERASCCLPIVRELLRHGAEVNACDNCGESALYCVVRVIDLRIIYLKRFGFDYNCESDMEIVKELLEYGADMNSNLINYDGDPYWSLLGVAIRCQHLPLIRMLIKYAILNHSNENYKQIVNLDPFVEEDNFKAIKEYFSECKVEIFNMKIDYACSNYHTLYDFVANKANINKRPLCCNNEVEIYISSNYPVYHDIILPNIKDCIETAKLLEKLRDIKICSVSSSSQTENEVILIPDCVIRIGEYLCKNDLLNFIEAFDGSY